MTPAQRVLAAAALHRRSRGTARWFSWAAGMSERGASDALRDMMREGRATKEASAQSVVYDLIHIDDIE